MADLRRAPRAQRRKCRTSPPQSSGNRFLPLSVERRINQGGRNEDLRLDFRGGDLAREPSGTRRLTGRPGWFDRADRCPIVRRAGLRSEEHTSELQSRFDLVCRLLLEKKKTQTNVKQVRYLHGRDSHAVG